MHAARNADPARFRKLLQARRHIDAVAVDVVPLDNDVTDIDADAKLHPLIGSQAGIALDNAALHVDGTAHCVDYAGKLQQQTVPCGFDDATTVFSDLGVDQITPVSLQPRQGVAVVSTHEARVPHHIG